MNIYSLILFALAAGCTAPAALATPTVPLTPTVVPPSPTATIAPAQPAGPTWDQVGYFEVSRGGYDLGDPFASTVVIGLWADPDAATTMILVVEPMCVVHLPAIHQDASDGGWRGDRWMVSGGDDVVRYNQLPAEVQRGSNLNFEPSVVYVDCTKTPDQIVVNYGLSGIKTLADYGWEIKTHPYQQ